METHIVADWMRRQFITLSPDMPVVQAASVLVTNELLGGPVVDEAGTLIGWISEQDCVSAVLQVYYHGDRVATVADVMRRDVLTVRPEDSIFDLANQMRGQKPKIYPVIDEQHKVLGVISRRQVLRKMCENMAAEKD